MNPITMVRVVVAIHPIYWFIGAFFLCVDGFLVYAWGLAFLFGLLFGVIALGLFLAVTAANRSEIQEALQQE